MPESLVELNHRDGSEHKQNYEQNKRGKRQLKVKKHNWPQKVKKQLCVKKQLAVV